MTALTSNVTVGTEDAGCRRVTEETVPVPDKMQTALGLCWANDNIFETISYKEQYKEFQINMPLDNDSSAYKQMGAWCACVCIHVITQISASIHVIFYLNIFNHITNICSHNHL